MSKPCQLLMSFVLLTFLTTSGVAQDNLSDRTHFDVTIASSGERVRFTAPSSVVQMHLEVYTESALKLFDFELKGGNVLDWHLENAQAERIAPGSYICVVTVKSLSGKLTQRIGQVKVEKSSASVERIDASQITTQQMQAIGPIEENASLIVLKEDENQTTTVIAHNGEEGQIIRGKGALSFRIGDFFGGKDTEQMRLTAEGNLGIGITHPQVRLDVDGLIRASQGIIFADGTIQYSAASKTLGAKSSMPDQPSDQILGGKHKFQTEATGTGTQNHIAKWMDSAGTLGDSSIIESLSGGINVATFGGQPTGSSNNHVVEVVAPGTKTPLTLVAGSGSMEFWKDQSGGGGLPTAAVAFGMARPGAVSANDMVFSSWNGSAWNERMRMTNGGNMGIGTASPLGKLQVVTANDSNPFFVPAWDTRHFVVGGLGNSGGIGMSYDQTNNVGYVYALSPNVAFRDLVLQPAGGNVGVGTTGPFAKLHAVAGGSLIGVFGESSSNAGVHGFSSNSYGVSGTTAGTSFNVAGVYGEATGSLGTVVGVYGKATNDPNGTGMSGFGNAVGGYFQAGGKGVHGVSTSNAGFGGVFSNTAGGIVLKAEGNVAQNLGSGGWVKAIVLINADGTIARCYNSQASGSAVSTAPCGFSATRHDEGLFLISFLIDFGFQVNNRFILATAFNLGGGDNTVSPWNDPRFNTPSQLMVHINSGSFACPFFIFVF